MRYGCFGIAKGLMALKQGWIGISKGCFGMIQGSFGIKKGWLGIG